MKSFSLIVRLHQRHLDEKRLEIAKLLQSINHVDHQVRYLLCSLEKEKNLTHHDHIYQNDFYLFRSKVFDRCYALEKNKKHLLRMLAVHQEELQEIFKEKKSYETIIKRNQQKKIYANQQNEQKFLDEIPQKKPL